MRPREDSIEKAKVDYAKSVKLYAAMAAVAWLLFAFVYLPAGKLSVFGALILLLSVPLSWLLGWSAICLASLSLGERRTQIFQAIVALLAPIALGGTLATNVDHFAFSDAKILSWWTTIPLVILLGLGWGVGQTISSVAPVRAFLGASAALFLIAWLGQSGYSIQSDDYDPEGSSYVVFNEDDVRAAKETGTRVLQFGGYVLFVYGGIIGGMLAARHPIFVAHRRDRRLSTDDAR